MKTMTVLLMNKLTDQLYLWEKYTSKFIEKLLADKTEVESYMLQSSMINKINLEFAMYRARQRYLNENKKK